VTEERHVLPGEVVDAGLAVDDDHVADRVPLRSSAP
jgi:hypothetical protein